MLRLPTIRAGARGRAGAAPRPLARPVAAAAPEGASGGDGSAGALADWWRRPATATPSPSAADAAAALARPHVAPPNLPPPGPEEEHEPPYHPPPPPPVNSSSNHQQRDFLDVRQVSLFELFDGEAFTFTVPVYQRPYSWRHKQVFELLHDLESAYNGGREYFLGAIVTTRGQGGGGGDGSSGGNGGGGASSSSSSSSSGRRGASSSSSSDASYYVIDGQQRLTTLVILLAYLRDWAHRRSTAAGGGGANGANGNNNANSGEDPVAAAALAARLRRMLHIDADPLDPSSRPRYRLQLRPADQRFFRDNVLESFLPFKYHLSPTLAAAADADGSAAELEAADAAADAVVSSAAASGRLPFAGAVASARGGRSVAPSSSSSAAGGAKKGGRRGGGGGTSRQATTAADESAAAAAAAAAAEGPQSPASFPLASEASWALYSAARYLAAQLDSAAARGLDVPRFVAHVMRGCHVVVMTARDEAASFRIFSTLNGRGVDLSPVDKLKADLLRAVGGEGEGGGKGEEGGAGGGGAARRAAYADRWQAAESALGRGAFHRLFDHIRTVEEAAMAYGGASAPGEEQGGAGGGGGGKPGGSLFVPLFDLGALLKGGGGGGGSNKKGGGGDGGNSKSGSKGGKGSAASAAAAAVAATAPSSSFLPLGLARAAGGAGGAGGASPAGAGAAGASSSPALAGVGVGGAPVPSSSPGAAGMLDHFAPRTSDSEAAAELLDVLLEYAHRALLIRQNDWGTLEAEGGSGPQVAAELRDACFFAAALRDDAWTPWCLEFWHQVDDDRKRAAFLRGAERLQLYCDLREAGEGPGYRHARWAAVGAELLARPFYSDRVLGALALTADEKEDFLSRLASRDLAAEADERTLAHLLLRAEWGCRFAAGGGAPGGGAAAAAAAQEADAKAQRRRRRVDWRRLRVERVLPQHPPEGSTWRRVRLQVAAAGDEGAPREVKYWGYEVLRANWQARLGNAVLLQPTPAAAAAALAAAGGGGNGGGGGASAAASAADFAAKSAYYRACGGGDPLLFPEFTGGVSGVGGGALCDEAGDGGAASARPSFSRDAFSPDECRARHAALLARLADVFELGSTSSTPTGGGME